MADEQPIIPDLPPAPLRSEPEEVFSEKASAFVGAMNPWGQVVNDVAAWIYGAWVSITGYREDTEVFRNEAVDASAEAVAAATAATAVVDAQPWVSGQAYAQGEATISLVDFQTYRRKTAGSSSTDPANDATNWAQITGVSALPAMGGKANRALVVNASETAAEWSGFQLGTNAQGNKTISTGDPSGGQDGDIHYKVEA